ncbi:hypothetical protein KKH39_02305 [Patescibacteria group bacterium]|nr:hypothetical protein [Patescibacteria group bacterium]
MSTLDDQATNNLTSKKWVDNLLVKDEAGKFTTLSGKEIVKSVNKEFSSAVSEGNAAPKNDNFVPIQYISGSSDSPAQFAFHPDDLKEVETLAKTMPKDDSKKYGVEKIVDRIINKQEINIDSGKKDSFINILFDFFRNRKSIIATRDRLSSDIKLSAEKIDEVVSVVKSIKSRIDSVGGLVVKMSEMKANEKIPELPEVETKEKLLETSKPILEKEEEPVEKPEKTAETIAKGEIAQEQKIASSPSVEGKKETKPASGFDLIKEPDVKKAELVEKSVEAKKIQDIPVKLEEKPKISLPKVSRPMAQSAPRQQITDVQKSSEKNDRPIGSHVLTGPVKEIESFDLVAFRRLGTTTQDIVTKILDKINLLEQDSYTKKAQGIKAWRNSPLYKLYLDLGAQSMSEGEEISSLIERLKKEGKETLSTEEFSAISDLNRKMRF